MTYTALIVAGGRGERMHAPIPKQLLPLNGRPILMWTIEAFLRFDPDIAIVLVLPEDQKVTWKELCKEHKFDVPHQIVFGGSTRFKSVRQGLEGVSDEGMVAIHDGVRPLLKKETIKRLFESCKSFGNAIPVVYPTESVRQVHCQDNRVINRNSLRMIQTPQVFTCSYIKHAYIKEYEEHFTDDATVLEAAGHRINLVQGQAGNLKITTPEDLKIASALLSTMI